MTLATTLSPCIKPPSGILDIFKRVRSLFQDYLFQKEKNNSYIPSLGHEKASLDGGVLDAP